MKKSVKLLTVFVVIFMLPIAAYSDGRVRFNYRVTGSTSNPELGSKSVSSYTQLDGSSATGADKLGSQSFSSFSLHYVSGYGLGFLGGGEILLGMYQFDTSYKTNITCTSVWITGGAPVCASGILLATRTASGTSRSLDLGYVYPTLTTYLSRYFPAHSFLIPENFPVPEFFSARSECISSI